MTSPLATTLSLAPVVLLIALLVAKELVRAAGGDGVQASMRRFNVAIVPLLVIFGVIILTRLMSFLYY